MKLFHEIQSLKDVAPYLNRLLTAVEQEIQSEKVVRRWSFEIEANRLGACFYELQELGFDTKNDGSVNYTWDGCDCDTCQHSCDCEHCEYSNGWDTEPCEDSQATEASPNRLNKITTADWEGKIRKACQILERSCADVDESTGGHIHIDAGEMTNRQLANVMRVWDKIQDTFPELVGRTYSEAEGYADRIESDHISEAENGRAYNRPSVNITNAINHRTATHYKNTIEFRQFSGTLDAEMIMARGLLCRRLVEHAEANLPLYYILNATSPDQILRELKI